MKGQNKRNLILRNIGGSHVLTKCLVQQIFTSWCLYCCFLNLLAALGWRSECFWAAQRSVEVILTRCQLTGRDSFWDLLHPNSRPAYWGTAMINWYLETKRSQRDKKERNKDRKKWQSPLKSSEAVRCTKGKRALIDAGSSFFLCLCRWYLWVQTKKLCSVFEFFWNSSIAFYKTSISEILNTKLPLRTFSTFSTSQASPQSLLLWFTYFNTFGKRWDQCHQPHLMKRQPSQKVTVSDDNSYQSCKNETFCILLYLHCTCQNQWHSSNQWHKGSNTESWQGF